MPVSIVIKFKTKAKISSAELLFTKFLKLDDFKLVNTLPITLSQVASKSGRREDYFEPHDDLWIRASFLTDEVVASFFDSLFSGTDNRIILSDIQYFDNEWALSKDYDTLWEMARSNNFISMVFESPTMAEGDLLPVPVNIFRSLLSKWNCFSPYPIESKVLDIVKSYISADVSSVKIDRDGFTGKVNFTISRNVNEEYRRFINVLADFSFFSGVGDKTLMGMGMCRRIK